MVRKVFFTVLVFFLLSSHIIYGSINYSLNEIKQQIDRGEYEKALVELNNIEQACNTDTSAQVRKDFNLNMGVALFFTEKYEQAIPYLQNAFQYMSFKPEEGDCEYVETIYGIASCYYKIKDYKNAESYYRKAVLKNEIQPFACDIMSQVYTELAELYKKTNQPTLADECIKKLEQNRRETASLNLSTGNWKKAVEDIFAVLPSFDLLKLEDKPKVVDAFSSILDIINNNIGKNNDEYIQYCSLYATIMQYKYHDTIAAKDINTQLIDIGRKLTVNKPEIASAYEDYLRLVSCQNELELVKTILPEAVKYYNETTNKNRDEANLYEVVGMGLWSAGNNDEAISFLEMEWDKASKHSIGALGCLADYYYKIDPAKALSYFYQSEELSRTNARTNYETKIVITQNIIQLNEQLGNYNEAITYGNKLTPLLSAIGNKNRLAKHLTDIGVIYGKNHDLINAENTFSSIDTIYDSLSQDYRVYYLSNKGYTYLICEEYDKAIESLIQSINTVLYDKGGAHPLLGIIYHNLGRAYMLQKKYDDALNWLYKSKELQMSNNGNVIDNTIKYISECEKNK